MVARLSGHTFLQEATLISRHTKSFEAGKRLEVRLDSHRTGGWSAGQRRRMALCRDNEERAVEPGRPREFRRECDNHVIRGLQLLRGGQYERRMNQIGRASCRER